MVINVWPNANISTIDLGITCANFSTPHNYIFLHRYFSGNYDDLNYVLDFHVLSDL